VNAIDITFMQIEINLINLN